ncbi:KEOPS complex subunit Pcc1 [Halorientalis brevis]|uniref:KEOPS complex subunit Pcc1 n=1 Tax=Halorientalis brevis TaxID=1126241 RepID=A0ABD6CCY5_9EURY|nr:KEOPS complex subunit Pcc1 [Halorientalis brevis]
MTRRATITTTHGDDERAARVAAALRPDNTDEMETTADGETVRTTIEREGTGGLHATVDDYVVNLRIADQLTDTTQS